MTDVEKAGLFVIIQGLRIVPYLLEPLPGPLRAFLPGRINEPGPRQFCGNLILVSSIENGRDGPESQPISGPTQVGLQDLADVHPARHTQGVENELHWSAIGQVRHVLNRQHPGDHPLVAMAASHLVALGELAPLSHANPHHFVHARRQVSVFIAGEDLHVNHPASLTVGQAQARILDLPGLFAKDGSEEFLLRGQLLLTLGSDLAHQNVIGSHLCPDVHDTMFIEVLEGILSHIGDVASDLLRTKPGVAGLDLVFLDMKGGELVASH